MRIIGEIPHPDYKITLYSWNNRYLIKIEQNFLEQTYKIDQFELTGEQELHQILKEEFLAKVTYLFSEMEAALRKAQQAL